ncbi:MAG: H/ACA ribonucleoprotein complex subunit GAR1 [Candidatus Ranarchaeia archaeon]
MIKLGTVIHVTASKRLIVQSTKVPRLGSIVFDDNVKVGVVKDVFGPKSHPFVAVVPRIPMEQANELVGKKLFFSENHRRKFSRNSHGYSSQGPRKTRQRNPPGSR